ncbi:MAG: hypothetical protein SGILL_000160 [Bacillariaceae sp.]
MIPEGDDRDNGSNDRVGPQFEEKIVSKSDRDMSTRLAPGCNLIPTNEAPKAINPDKNEEKHSPTRLHGRGVKETFDDIKRSCHSDMKNEDDGLRKVDTSQVKEMVVVDKVPKSMRWSSKNIETSPIWPPVIKVAKYERRNMSGVSIGSGFSDSLTASEGDFLSSLGDDDLSTRAELSLLLPEQQTTYRIRYDGPTELENLNKIYGLPPVPDHDDRFEPLSPSDGAPTQPSRSKPDSLPSAPRRESSLEGLDDTSFCEEQVKAMKSRPDVWITPFEGDEVSNAVWKVKRVWEVEEEDEKEQIHSVHNTDLFTKIKTLVGAPDSPSYSSSPVGGTKENLPVDEIPRRPSRSWHVLSVVERNGRIDDLEPEKEFADDEMEENIGVIAEEAVKEIDLNKRAVEEAKKRIRLLKDSNPTDQRKTLRRQPASTRHLQDSAGEDKITLGASARINRRNSDHEKMASRSTPHIGTVGGIDEDTASQKEDADVGGSTKDAHSQSSPTAVSDEIIEVSKQTASEVVELTKPSAENDVDQNNDQTPLSPLSMSRSMDGTHTTEPGTPDTRKSKIKTKITKSFSGESSNRSLSPKKSPCKSLHKTHRVGTEAEGDISPPLAPPGTPSSHRKSPKKSRKKSAASKSHSASDKAPDPMSSPPSARPDTPSSSSRRKSPKKSRKRIVTAETNVGSEKAPEEPTVAPPDTSYSSQRKSPRKSKKKSVTTESSNTIDKASEKAPEAPPTPSFSHRKSPRKAKKVSSKGADGGSSNSGETTREESATPVAPSNPQSPPERSPRKTRKKSSSSKSEDRSSPEKACASPKRCKKERRKEIECKREMQLVDDKADDVANGMSKESPRFSPHRKKNSPAKPIRRKIEVSAMVHNSDSEDESSDIVGSDTESKSPPECNSRRNVVGWWQKTDNGYPIAPLASPLNASRRSLITREAEVVD